MDQNPEKTDRMALIIVVAIILMALLVLSKGLAHADRCVGAALLDGCGKWQFTPLNCHTLLGVRICEGYTWRCVSAPAAAV